MWCSRERVGGWGERVRFGCGWEKGEGMYVWWCVCICVYIYGDLCICMYVLSVEDSSSVRACGLAFMSNS